VGRVTGITYHRDFGDVMDIVKRLDVGKRWFWADRIAGV